MRVGVTAGASTPNNKIGDVVARILATRGLTTPVLSAGDCRCRALQPAPAPVLAFSIPTRYIALGDSMSIDLYPALDAGEIDVAVALERVTHGGTRRAARRGVAALSELDEHWPDDVGNDLSSMYPGIAFENLATDGATIGEVFGEQLPQLDGRDEPLLITLTIGGNDLLSAFGNRPRRTLLDRIAADVAEAYDFLVDLCAAGFRTRTIILTTVYDPSDGLARIPGVFDDVPELPLARARPAERSHSHARARHAERAARRRARAFSRARRVGGGSGSLVLAAVARRAERARRERDPARLAGRARRQRDQT